MRKHITRLMLLDIIDSTGAIREHVNIRLVDDKYETNFRNHENHDMVFPDFVIQNGQYIMKCLLLTQSQFDQIMPLIKDLKPPGIIKKSDSEPKLKDKERVVIKLKNEGLTLAAIAKEVHISRSGVKKRFERLYARHEVTTFQKLLNKVKSYY